MFIKMNIKLFICYLLLKIVTAKIFIDVDVDNEGKVTVNSSGVEMNIITDDDIKLFNLDISKLKEAIKKHYNTTEPNDIYFKSPTPWGDLYKSYNFKQVEKALYLKSAIVKSISKRPVIVLSHDFENLTNETIKVNTGISHSVTNMLTTTWSKEKEFKEESGVSCELNLKFVSLKGNIQHSYTDKWGINDQKSEIVTIGTSSGMEMNLKPGQAVTAVLSANAGYLEIEFTYEAILLGDLAVNFSGLWNGHHFYKMPIHFVMKSGNIINEKTAVETIRFGYHVDASLMVYDKRTGLLL